MHTHVCIHAGGDGMTLWSSHIPSARGYLKDAIKRTTDGVPLYSFTTQNINTQPVNTSVPPVHFPAFNNSAKIIPAKSDMTHFWVDVAIGPCRKIAREAGSGTCVHDSPAKRSDASSHDHEKSAAEGGVCVHDWDHVTWQLGAVCHATYSKDGTCVLNVHEEREEDPPSACAPVRTSHDEESLQQGWSKCYDPATGYVSMCVRVPIHVCMCICTHICICLCAYMYLFMYVCVYALIYVCTAARMIKML